MARPREKLVVMDCDPDGCRCLRCGGVSGFSKCHLCIDLYCKNYKFRPCRAIPVSEYQKLKYQEVMKDGKSSS